MSTTSVGTSIEAHLLPIVIKDGEPLTVQIKNAMPFRNMTVSVEAHYVTAVETSWLFSFPVELDEQGCGTISLDSGVTIGEEAVIYVHSITEIIRVPNDDFIEERTGQSYVFPPTWMTAVNARGPLDKTDSISQLLQDLQGRQFAYYSQPIGDTDAEGTRTYRAFSLIEGVKITTELRFPGVVVHSLGEGLTGREHAELANEMVQGMGWRCRVQPENWRTEEANRTPLAIMIFSEVVAADPVRAGTIVRETREPILSLLALNRLARGQSFCSVFEEVQEGGKTFWFYELPRYRGNLAGGMISGESQAALVQQVTGQRNDPLLALCCDMIAEALSSHTDDNKYLKYWTILELLSQAAIHKNVTVHLVGGAPWPNDKRSAANAKPRVYEYISRWLAQSQMQEANLVFPARDLFEAVTVWYARRNATGHYGKFSPDEPLQMKQSWYKNAMKSWDDPQSQWLITLREVTVRVLTWELGLAASRETLRDEPGLDQSINLQPTTE
ncbi:hypothetical protein [Timonella senegalensis]|uniref:hypothetical protein n=1 Tax=Timonella senegalensis TaxID=1465825 RepID=UPI002FDE21B1